MFEEYQRIKEEMELVYLHDRRPWMIGYSGGKDSTLSVSIRNAGIAAERETLETGIYCDVRYDG